MVVDIAVSARGAEPIAVPIESRFIPEVDGQP
jgi:hypothetical protein